MRFLAKAIPLILLSAIALSGAAFLLWANKPFGMGVAHDSMFYFSMAKHMAAGKGAYVYMRDVSSVSIPFAHHCPFYSVCLAVLFLFGLSIETSVWILNGILFGANLLVAGYLVYRYSKSLFAALLAECFFCLDPLWLEYHSWALTEGLFLLETNLAIFFIISYLEKNRKRDFYFSALAAGLATVTRYTGISYPIAGFLCLIFLVRAPFRIRAAKAFYYSVVSSLPFVIWIVRNIIRLYEPGAPLSVMAFGDLGIAKVAKTFTALQYLQQSATETLRWLAHYAPLSLTINPDLVIFIFMACTVSAVIIFYRRKTKKIALPPWAMAAVVVTIYAFTYLIFLIEYLVLSLQGIVMDIRYLLYFFTYLILLASFCAASFVRKVRALRQPVFRAAGVLLIGLVLGIGFTGAFSNAKDGLMTARDRGTDQRGSYSYFFVDTRKWLPD